MEAKDKTTKEPLVSIVDDDVSVRRWDCFEKTDKEIGSFS
jgi:hypothetical protein